MRASGRFYFLRHGLKMRSYKIIFVDDVTSWIRRCGTTHFMYLDFMFFGIFMFPVVRNFVLRRCFNFRFIHERMFWEELDDYPEVIQSSFLTLKQSARTVLG